MIQVAEKYKQTDLGLIPFDWDVKAIDLEIDLLTGFPFPSSGYSENGIRLLRCSNVKRGETDWSKGIVQYWANITPELKPYILKEGDIVIAMDGSLVGKSFARLTLDDLPALLLQRVARIRSNKLDLGYLKEFICSDYFTKYCDIVKTSSAIPHISPKDIRGFIIPIPRTKNEQIAIATALSDADALISRLEKLIAKKHNIKQGVMKKILQPKEGWVVKTLGDFLDYEQPTEYLVTDTEYNDNNQTPVLTAGKTFILGYTNEENGIFKNLPVIIFDDFTTAIKFVDFPFKAKSSAMKMLIPKNDSVNLRFIYEIMSQIKYPLGDHKRHWIGEYRHLEITVPATQKEQTHIATILSDMEAEITALETKLMKYKNIKQGMMQNLLTGKIRLV